jgi:hypothetical protein
VALKTRCLPSSASSTCKGVDIGQDEGPGSTQLPEAIRHRIGKEGTWRLSIDFTHGARTQEWKMMTRTSLAPYYYSGETKGEGDPKAIARDICSIVTAAVLGS